MSRADLEAAAAERYPWGSGWAFNRVQQEQRAAYIQGRLDQAEEDAQIAEDAATETGEGIAEWIAAEIRKGVE